MGFLLKFVCLFSWDLHWYYNYFDEWRLIKSFFENVNIVKITQKLQTSCATGIFTKKSWLIDDFFIEFRDLSPIFSFSSSNMKKLSKPHVAEELELLLQDDDSSQENGEDYEDEIFNSVIKNLFDSKYWNHSCIRAPRLYEWILVNILAKHLVFLKWKMPLDLPRWKT